MPEAPPSPSPSAPAATPAVGLAPSGNALPPGSRIGEFELLAVAGEGGFSIVYRAWDHMLRRQVALKEYLPHAIAGRGDGQQVRVKSPRNQETFDAGLQSFVKEARMLAQFDHPSLVKVFRFWEANGSAYMVMPFYQGQTLREVLRERAGPPDEATLLGWLGPVADALTVIHAAHFYHRDVAPDNVMLLAGTGQPLLLDFGAARQVIGDMTQALTVILKPGFAPLEQYGDIPGMRQGPWTDVYQLAATAYYALVGRTPPTAVGRVMNDSFESLTRLVTHGYRPQVLAALDHALAVRPEARTRDIAQFKAELGLPPPPQVAPGSFADHMPPEPPPAVPLGATLALPPAALPAAMARRQVDPAAGPASGGAPAEAAPEAAAGQPTARRSVLLAGVGIAALLLVAAAAWWAMRPAPKVGDTVAAANTAAPVPAPAPSAATAPPPAPSAAGTATQTPANATAASAPAPAADARATTSPAFDAPAEFARVVQARTPGWGIGFTVDRQPLRIDRDKLRFTLHSEQAGLVYLFHHSSDGQLIQLFPNQRVPELRVAAGGTLKLPAAPIEFDVTGPAGVSQMLAIVSRWPRDHGALAPREQDGYRVFAPDAAALARARTSALPALAGTPRCPAAGCDDGFAAATASYDVLP